MKGQQIWCESKADGIVRMKEDATLYTCLRSYFLAQTVFCEANALININSRRIMHFATPTEYMQLALELAQRGRFTVAPNPMVGCVIVNNDRIVGRGFHQRAGGPHAEIYALDEAGALARGATVYVTLEPCCHHGRTPPCTDALIKAGIKKLYIAGSDPNPLVSGKSIKLLKEAGIEIEMGLCAEKARHLNQIFFHYIKYKRPLVIAKWAMSFDGKTTTHLLDSRQISNEKSQASAHAVRQQVDAIVIGANTAIQDNPSLTVRHTSMDTAEIKQPLRIVLASRGSMPLDLTIFDPAMPAKTLVATTNAADKDWLQQCVKKNITVIMLDKDKDGRINLLNLLLELGKREITSILVEGGMTVLQSFFAEKLVNKVQVYLTPTIIAGLTKKQPLKNINFSQLDNDFYFTADYEELTHV